MSEELKKWGWAIENDERAYGPFDTREAAEEDARVAIDEGHAKDERVTVLIGHCVSPAPEDYSGLEVGVVLMAMDENAADDYPDVDDEVFDIIPNNRVKAKKDLEARLKEWAKKWVKTDVWTLGEVARIELVGGDE